MTVNDLHAQLSDLQKQGRGNYTINDIDDEYVCGLEIHDKEQTVIIK